MRETYLPVLSWGSPTLLDWASRRRKLDTASWIVGDMKGTGSSDSFVSRSPFPVKSRETTIDIAPLPRWREPCGTLIVFHWSNRDYEQFLIYVPSANCSLHPPSVSYPVLLGSRVSGYNVRRGEGWD